MNCHFIFNPLEVILKLQFILLTDNFRSDASELYDCIVDMFKHLMNHVLGHLALLQSVNWSHHLCHTKIECEMDCCSNDIVID